MPIVDDLGEVRRILEETRSIAVLGASDQRERAGYYVGAYLAEVGYETIGVTPVLAGRSLWGRPVVPTLADLPHPVDLIDVFRNPTVLPGHVDEILALPWRPRCVWFQLLVWHPPSAERLSQAGIAVVQNRCTYSDHQRFGIPRLAPGAG